MDTDHHRVFTLSAVDLDCCPRERARGANGTWLNDDVVRRHIWCDSRDCVAQRFTRKNECLLGRNDRCETLQSIHQQRLRIDEREQLFWPSPRAQRPEPRADAAGENDSPAAQSLPSGKSAPSSAATPVSRAMSV